MPGLLLDNMELPPHPIPPEPKAPDYGFAVSHQKVELDIDFATQSLNGRVDIQIIPHSKDLRTIKIDARQCLIGKGKVLVNNVVADFEYTDPMKVLELPPYLDWSASQYDQQRDRLKPLTDDMRSNGALEITFPRGVRVEEIDPFSENGSRALVNGSREGANGPLSATPISTPKTAPDQTNRFLPIDITIFYSVRNFRDGLHFVGLSEGDQRFPYVYTRHSSKPGTASCIFPCIDDPAMRCTWDITIKCSRNLGDAVKRKPRSHHKTGIVNGVVSGVKYIVKGFKNGVPPPEEYEVTLSETDKMLEMVVICSGEMMDEIVDKEDSSKKVISFQCGAVVAPHHIGFSIGPFEEVDLTIFREDDEGDKLGQSQALAITGYCLPGRTPEVRNTCTALAHAIDWFSLQYGHFPFTEYSMVFVDDQTRDTEHIASMSLCSNRLLFPETLIDPMFDSSRKLIQAAATQWFGVGIVPAAPCDSWITIGLAHFMAGLFEKIHGGRNAYYFRQKVLTDRLVELDLDRPSLYSLGEILHLGDFEYDFMALKAPLVMFILDNRILKASGGGTAGLTRVIAKLVMGANTGGAADSVVDTQAFRRVVDKITKYRSLEPFWNQWVLGAGCPRFQISQKFNKKQAAVEMTIQQKQDTLPTQRKLKKEAFPRELKEELHGVYAAEMQPLFTGPMTIRIHEADGTPYEHTLEVTEGTQKIVIPYNTKYKRLKRTRHQKERMNNARAADLESGDALFYCLGDTLQDPQEMREWGLSEWNEDQLKSMDAEHYEWIRVDADFEWLCEKTISIPAYMYVSQLQQDQSVVAQQESMMFLKNHQAHPLVATFLIRTLMDPRYYWEIRVMAAEILKIHALPNFNWVGMKHLQKAFEDFSCLPGGKTPRQNDFRDVQAYFVDCAIPRAMSMVRSLDGKCPKEARQSIFDMLRFNDNGNNVFSDVFKIANLLNCLADSLIPQKDSAAQSDLNFGDEEEDEELNEFKGQVLQELERFRRMEEWDSSYHNIYTTTILECKQKLMKAKVIPMDPLEFAQYLHDGTYDGVRIKAFESLVDLGYLANNAIAKLLLNVLSTDSSPYVRSHLFEVFCLGLATIAFGEGKAAAPAPAAVDREGDVQMDGEPDGLIVQDASTELRKAQIVRTTSIEGALAALKEELKENEVLKGALWNAINSTMIGVSEQRDLLDICSVLYDAVESMVVKLRLPRYWGVRNLGKAVLAFKETDRVRQQPRIILQTKGPKPVILGAPVVATPPPLKLNFTSSGAARAASVASTASTDGTMKPPPKRPAPERTPSSEGSPAKKVKADKGEKTRIVNLKVPPHRLAAILSRPSNPIIAIPHPKAPSSARGSPAPKPSPAFSTSSPAPSTISVSPAPSLSSGNSVPPKPARKPLPDSSAVRKPLPDSGGGRKPLPDAASGRKPLPGSAPPPQFTPPPVARAGSQPLKIKLNMKPRQSSPPS